MGQFSHELVWADEKNSHLKNFSCLFGGPGGYFLSNTNIQLIQAFKCSLSSSYPVLETALGISKRSQIFISLWQAVFYFKQQECLCAWKICLATANTKQFWGSCVQCKATGQVSVNYPTAAFFFFLKVNGTNSWSTLCDMLQMNLCQVLFCISLWLWHNWLLLDISFRK